MSVVRNNDVSVRVRVVGRMRADTFPQHLLQRDRMLLQQVAESFISQILQLNHPVLRQSVESISAPTSLSSKSNGPNVDI
jgi:hypothetical protein